VEVTGIKVCETKYREKYRILNLKKGPIQHPRGLRCGSAAARLLGLRIRIPLGARMSLTCECYVLSRRGLCGGMIIRPGESHRIWRVFECEREASMMRRMLRHGRKNWRMKMENIVGPMRKCIIKVFIFTNGCTIHLLGGTLKFTLKFTLKLLLRVSVLSTILREHIIDLS